MTGLTRKVGYLVHDLKRSLTPGASRGDREREGGRDEWEERPFSTGMGMTKCGRFRPGMVETMIDGANQNN
jgi:hypothetical protein